MASEQLELQLAPRLKIVGPVHSVSFDPEDHRVLLWHTEAVDVTERFARLYPTATHDHAELLGYFTAGERVYYRGIRIASVPLFETCGADHG